MRSWKKKARRISCLSTRDALYHDENNLEYENVKVGEWKGHVVVWRAALLRSGAFGNTEKSPIHVVNVIRMMERSTQQGVGIKLLLKYGGAVDESGEYKENERSAGQGMTKRKSHADGERNTQAYREQQSATDSGRVLRGGMGGTARAADKDCFAWGCRDCTSC